MEPRNMNQGFAGRDFWTDVDFEILDLQKELFWTVVIEKVVYRWALAEVFKEESVLDVDLIIEGMIGNGYFEECNGLMRVHPNFGENSYLFKDM